MPDVFLAGKKAEASAREIKTGRIPKVLKKEESVPFRLRKHVKRGIFSSYSFLPSNIDFETREDEEKVVLLLRKHPITNISWIAISVVMLFAPGILGQFPLLSFLPDRYQFIAVLGWYLITMAYILENFLGWFYNVNILTDERIVDIDFYNMIYKEVSDANLDRIEDVTYRVGGAIRTVFNYGDVLVQTAGEVPNFEFSAVPKPADVAKILQDLRMEERQEELEGRLR